jgi:hypothetical protein
MKESDHDSSCILKVYEQTHAAQLCICHRPQLKNHLPHLWQPPYIQSRILRLCMIEFLRCIDLFCSTIFVGLPPLHLLSEACSACSWALET